MGGGGGKRGLGPEVKIARQFLRFFNKNNAFLNIFKLKFLL